MFYNLTMPTRRLFKELAKIMMITNNSTILKKVFPDFFFYLITERFLETNLMSNTYFLNHCNY